MELKDTFYDLKNLYTFVVVKVLHIPPQFVSKLIHILFLPTCSLLFFPYLSFSLPLVIVIRWIGHGIAWVVVHVWRRWRFVGMFCRPIYGVFWVLRWDCSRLKLRVLHRWRRLCGREWILGLGRVGRDGIGVGVQGILAHLHVDGRRRVHVRRVVGRLVRRIFNCTVCIGRVTLWRKTPLLFVSLRLPVFLIAIMVPLLLIALLVPLSISMRGIHFYLLWRFIDLFAPAFA